MQPIDYKSVFQALKERYPTIAQELAPEPKKTDLAEIEQLTRKFLIKNKCSIEDLQKNRDDLQVLFIAAIVKLYDPVFFIYRGKKLKNGLRAGLQKILQCDATWISHRLKNIRIYVEIYKNLKHEIEIISTQLL